MECYHSHGKLSDLGIENDWWHSEFRIASFSHLLGELVFVPKLDVVKCASKRQENSSGYFIL